MTDHCHSWPERLVDHHPCTAVSGKDVTLRGCLMGESVRGVRRGTHGNPDHGHGHDPGPIPFPFPYLSFVCKMIKTHRKNCCRCGSFAQRPGEHFYPNHIYPNCAVSKTAPVSSCSFITFFFFSIFCSVG